MSWTQVYFLIIMICFIELIKFWVGVPVVSSYDDGVPSHVWSSGARSHRGVSSCNNFTQAADTDRQAESLHSLHITGQHENTANWSSQTHISRVQGLRQCGQRQQTLTSSAGDGTWSRDSHPVYIDPGSSLSEICVKWWGDWWACLNVNHLSNDFLDFHLNWITNYSALRVPES